MAWVKEELRTRQNYQNVDMETIAPQVTDYAAQPAAEMPFRAPSAPISIPSTNDTPQAIGTNDRSTTLTPPTSESDTDMGNTGDAPSAMQTVGQGARELIKAIQKLEALSINATLPSLPKFVVVGDQSAGKSSLIEAACAISMPRSAGTCTRCPFQITTSASKEGQPDWTCRVVLIVRYKQDDDAHKGADGQDFDGWAKVDQFEYVFGEVHSKKELETMLRKAQLAILNPGIVPATFAAMSAAAAEQRQHESHQAPFSPNLISLEITGVDLPELSLFDLPGAINATATDDDQYLVDFIEALLTAYICDEKALILLACAANQDIETSTAFRYIRKYKAWKRCLGVLTKPDLLDESQTKLNQLDKMLRADSNTFKLGLGWYVTKQLSQKEMDSQVSYEEARRSEAAFFAQGVWSGPLRSYAERFGIPNLQKALSHLLTTDIINNLPEIFHRVHTRLIRVNNELASFPERAAAPGLTVITEIETLKTAIIKEIDPDSTTSGFRAPYQDVFRSLRDILMANKPVVIYDTPGYEPPPILLDSQEDEEMDDTPSKKAKNNGGRAVNSTPSRATATPRPIPGSSRTISGTDRARKTPAPQALKLGQAQIRTYFKLDEVKKRYDNAPGSDMPGERSNHVDRELKMEPLANWASTFDDAIRQIGTLFAKHLKQTVANALTTRKGTDLYTQAWQLSRELFDEFHAESTKTAKKLVKSHTRRPITYANSVWKPKIAQIKAALRNKRLEKRVEEYFDTEEGHGAKITNPQDRKKKAADPNWVAANIGVDEYERETEALAQPIAYYDHAAQQLVDILARLFEDDLMFEYGNRLHHHLLEGLDAMNADHCATLLAEDPVRDRERKALEEEKKKLEQALEDLHGLPTAHA